jgi:hypothetical protein
MKHLAPLKLLVGLNVAASLLSGHSAFAEPTSVEKARESFRAGAQAYGLGEYGAAIQAFEQAYALAPRPAVLFSIAQAERRLYSLTHDQAHLARAIEMYRQYLADETQPGRKSEAVQALSALEPLLVATDAGSRPSTPTTSAPAAPMVLPTRIMISSPAQNAVIALDDRKPLPSPIVREVAPGEHRVRISAAGYQPTEREVTAVAGALVSVDVPLVEQPARLEIVAPAGAQLSINGRVQGLCPFPKPLELPAGIHLITISKDGFVGVSREEVLPRGHTTVFTAPLKRSRQRTAAMFMLGASVASIVPSLLFSGLSYLQEKSARDFLASHGHRLHTPDDLAQYNASRQDRDRMRYAAWISAGVGLGLGLTSGILYTYDRGSVEVVEAQPRTAISAATMKKSLAAEPLVGPGIAGLGIQGSF